MDVTIEIQAAHDVSYFEYQVFEKVHFEYYGGTYFFIHFIDKNGYVQYEWDNPFEGIRIWLKQYEYLKQNPSEYYSIPEIYDGYAFWLTKDKYGFRFKCLTARGCNFDDFMVAYKDVQKFMDTLALMTEAE